MSRVGSAIEKFSMYGFSIDYPDGCRVEFNSKSRREAGDVAFQLPEKIGIFLSWGELEKVTKRFDSAEEHAAYSLETMKNRKKVRNFERVSHDIITLNDHNSSVNRIRFGYKATRLFPGGKNIPWEAYSLHVHCDKSRRYFVLYTMAPASEEARFDKLMESMRDSFSCH